MCVFFFCLLDVFTSAQLSITSEQHIINMMIMNMWLEFVHIYLHESDCIYSNHNYLIHNPSHTLRLTHVMI